MNDKKKLALLEDTFDVEAGTLTPEMELATISEYDSVARLSLIVMIDEEFGVSVSPEMVKSFVTVKDILEVMENDK